MLLSRIINPRTKSIRFLCSLNTTAEPSHLPSPEKEDEEKLAAEITIICKSFPNNLNWKTLNQNLKFINLNNSNLINKVLIQLKDPPNAKKALSFFHWSSLFTNITHQTYTYALITHILVNAKLVKDASALIESVLVRSVAGNDSSVSSFIGCLISCYDVTNSSTFVFDLLIQICSKLRMIDEAVEGCFCLGKHGFRLSVICYNTLLYVIQKSDKESLVWKVYEHMIAHRTYPNEKSVGIMVNALCKEGKLQTFVDMVDRIDGKRCLPKVIVNTCLIFRMIEDGRIEDGLVMMKRMLIKNMILDTISYSLIVYGRIKLGELESAWEVYEEMVKRGFKVNYFVHTSFIRAYCEVGKIKDGDELFKDMERVGLQVYDETYTHLIVGCAKIGRLEESLNFCEKMVQSGFVPSCLAFNGVVKRLNGHGNVLRANELLTLLLDKGFVPDVNTYSYLIAGYGKEGDVEGVVKLYYEMEYRKLYPGALVFTWLIVSLHQVGKFEESDRFLRIMKARSLVSSDCTMDMLIHCHNKHRETI